MTDTSKQNSGFFFKALTLMFVYLKLTGNPEVVTWSWWQVWSPMLILAALYFLIELCKAAVKGSKP